MEMTHLVSIIVATIAALSALASQRASQKSARKTTSDASRTDMEKDAYERARAFDTDTILRQNARISELGREIKALREIVRLLRTRLDKVDNFDHEGDDH